MSNSTVGVIPSHPVLLKREGQLQIQLSHICTGSQEMGGQDKNSLTTLQQEDSFPSYCFWTNGSKDVQIASWIIAQMIASGWEKRSRCAWDDRICNVTKTWHCFAVTPTEKQKSVWILLCRLRWDHINALRFSPQVKRSKVKGYCDSHQTSLHSDAL